MSAERLREAAALMRSRVAAAPEQTETATRVEGVWLNSRHYLTTNRTRELAVADLLEDLAFGLEGGWLLATPLDGPALKVADAYLGATS